MYNQYGQQGYPAGYNTGQQQQQQPMQQQRTGFQPTSTFGQQQFGMQAQGQGQGQGQGQLYGGQGMPQQQQQQPGPYQQPQQTGYMPQTGFQAQQTGYQPSGFGGGMNTQAIPQQRTGYNAPLQQQQTGYAPYNQSMGQQPQQQFQQQFQQQAYGMQPQATGFAGFSSTLAPQPLFTPQAQSQQQTAQPAAAPKLKQQKTGANIPSTRLSFVSAAEQQKFEDLFAKAVPSNKTALEGDEAKKIFQKSGLAPDQLSRIWALADTTRSGQLLFPEFVLAMHLINKTLMGSPVPNKVDDKTSNEVSSMVDRIAFSAPDVSASQPSSASNNRYPQPASNAPNFESNTALLGSIQQQPSLFQTHPQQQGFGGQGFQAQQTGYGQQQAFQPQPTGYQVGHGLQPGLTGVQQPGVTGLAPLMSQPTGPGVFAAQYGMQPLTSQPTGRPGEWGFVNGPAQGLPGMQAMGMQMMPGVQGQIFQPQQMQQQKADVPWAITKQEKAMFDTIHQAWDKKKQGFVEGPVAIEIFGQSGLPRNDLELIWALADTDDKGKLNADEFAVALHLIYRKLNGYEIPLQLPPELVPPSTRNFGESISQVKSMLQQDASSRNGPTSYMKSRSFKETQRDYSKDGTVYKYDDSDVAYTSSSRRRAPQPVKEERSSESLSSIADLKKRIKEKQVMLDAIDARDDAQQGQRDETDIKARQEADSLKREIRKVQAKLEAHANAHLLSSDDAREKLVLQGQLQQLVDQLPSIASQVRIAERRIQELQMEIFTAQDRKQNPGGATLKGTGPGGAITEADRRKAKTKAMMEARMAALTGKPAPKAVGDDDFEAAQARQATKQAELAKTRESNEQMIKDIEESADQLRQDIVAALGSAQASSAGEHERRRWQDAVGVEPEVRDFIRELGSAKPAVAPQTASAPAQANSVQTRAPAVPEQKQTVIEDRSAYLKQQAEQRMAERLAKLGIRPTKKSREPQALAAADQASPAATNIQTANSAPAEQQVVKEVLKEEKNYQQAALAQVDAQAKRAEQELKEAEAKKEAEVQRAKAAEAAGQLAQKDAVKQVQAASKPVDSRQAKLEKLRAERAARLAEEERLERELMEAESSSDDEKDSSPAAQKPVESSQTAPASVQAPPASSTNPFHKLEAHSAQQMDSTAETNPFHKLGQQAKAPEPAPIVAPPAGARPSVQPPAKRVNAPRARHQQNNDDWGSDSDGENGNSSSDEEGPSPADLAARLFSGGMQPQKTGGAATPLSAQRTGSAMQPLGIQRTGHAATPPPAKVPEATLPPAAPQAPPAPPAPPVAPPVPRGMPPVPQAPAGLPPPPPPAAPFAPPMSMPGAPPPPPMGMPGLPPPPPPMMGAPSTPLAPPVAGGPPPPPAPAAAMPGGVPQDRSALLQGIQAGKSLRKTKTVEKGTNVGGRVL